jgi:hypothetical protein
MLLLALMMLLMFAALYVLRLEEGVEELWEEEEDFAEAIFLPEEGEGEGEEEGEEVVEEGGVEEVEVWWRSSPRLRFERFREVMEVAAVVLEAVRSFSAVDALLD